MVSEAKKGFPMAGVLLMAALLAVGMVGLVFAASGDAKYVGVNKCKNCHASKDKGDQYGKWLEEKHSKAFDSLASDKAKELGKAKGIDDPQKSDKCIKCHVTAFGVDASKLDSKFDNKAVQCEACHGPGEKHVKARLAAAAEEDTGDDLFGLGEEEGGAERKAIPEGEINSSPDAKICQGCHNDESPTFKDFNFEEKKKEIEHKDPRPKP